MRLNAVIQSKCSALRGTSSAQGVFAIVSSGWESREEPILSFFFFEGGVIALIEY